MRFPFLLVYKNLFASRLIALRSLLTLASLVVAIFLVCFLRALVVSLDAGVRASEGSNRLIVQSAVSLFVDLPLSYQGQIEQVEGVKDVTKFQWFGGVYKEPKNFFGQFAVDPEAFQKTYPEVEIIEGDVADWGRKKRGCIIGKGLADRFNFEVGQTIPLIGTIFSKDEPWEFEVVAIYRSTKPNVDNGTLYFRFDYLEDSLESKEALGPKGCGVYSLTIEEGTDPQAVMSAIDGKFENGPQRVQCTTEAEFQRQFVSMLGNVPTFISSIGGGVLFAIVLAVLNTMLMAGRERTHDIGVMKALGFTDGTAFALLILESMLLCGLGGLLGVGLAMVSEPVFIQLLGTMFPGYSMTQEILLMGLGIAFVTGVVAGIVPAWRASRLNPVEALRQER